MDAASEPSRWQSGQIGTVTPRPMSVRCVVGRPQSVPASVGAVHGISGSPGAAAAGDAARDLRLRRLAVAAPDGDPSGSFFSGTQVVRRGRHVPSTVGVISIVAVAALFALEEAKHTTS